MKCNNDRVIVFRVVECFYEVVVQYKIGSQLSKDTVISEHGIKTLIEMFCFESSLQQNFNSCTSQQ